MTTRVPKRAMVLAAGLGQRMRPLTERLPKPLIPVRGRAMLDRTLDRLAAAGVEEAVVNLHHHPELLRRHLEGRRSPRVVFSPERELLETGGGIVMALPQLGAEPFYVVNGDVVWLDGVTPALTRLAMAFDAERMDALLLLHPASGAIGYEGPGDFLMDTLGLLRRRREWEVAPFVFAGLYLAHPRLFAEAPAGAFSVNLLWDRALEAGRLFGLRHDGAWYHVGTPAALALVEQELSYELGLPREVVAGAE